MSAGTANRFGQSLNMPNYAVSQQHTGINQGMPLSSNIFPSNAINTMRTSYSPMTSASSFNMMPAYTSQQQFGTSGLAASNTYAPYISSQISSLPSTGLLSSQTQLSTPQNMAYSSSF
jgi:hypothetical protein